MKEKISFKPGDLIFAKMKGFPFWPARIDAVIRENIYAVFFFGSHESAKMNVKNLYPYEKFKSKYHVERKVKWFSGGLYEVINCPNIYPYNEGETSSVDNKAQGSNSLEDKVTLNTENVDAKEAHGDGGINSTSSIPLSKNRKSEELSHPSKCNDYVENTTTLGQISQASLKKRTPGRLKSKRRSVVKTKDNKNNESIPLEDKPPYAISIGKPLEDSQSFSCNDNIRSPEFIFQPDKPLSEFNFDYKSYSNLSENLSTGLTRNNIEAIKAEMYIIKTTLNSQRFNPIPNKYNNTSSQSNFDDYEMMLEKHLFLKIDYYIKKVLNNYDADEVQCEDIIKFIETIDTSFEHWLRYPFIVSTLKKCSRYKSKRKSLRIRCLTLYKRIASEIKQFNNLKERFSEQNMDEMEITMEKDQLIIEQYKKRTLNLPSNEFIEISSCLNILETLMRQRNVKSEDIITKIIGAPFNNSLAGNVEEPPIKKIRLLDKEKLQNKFAESSDNKASDLELIDDAPKLEDKITSSHKRLSESRSINTSICQDYSTESNDKIASDLELINDAPKSEEEISSNIKRLSERRSSNTSICKDYITESNGKKSSDLELINDVPKSEEEISSNIKRLSESRSSNTSICQDYSSESNGKRTSDLGTPINNRKRSLCRHPRSNLKISAVEIKNLDSHLTITKSIKSTNLGGHSLRRRTMDSQTIVNASLSQCYANISPSIQSKSPNDLSTKYTRMSSLRNRMSLN